MTSCKGFGNGQLFVTALSVARICLACWFILCTIVERMLFRVQQGPFRVGDFLEFCLVNAGIFQI